MPDRWGRVNHNDWNAMTGMINNIQAMGQRNTLYKQQQDEIARQKQTREDSNTAFNAHINPQQIPDPASHVDGPVPGAPVPTKPQPAQQAMQGLNPEGKVRGSQLASSFLSLQDQIAQTKDAGQIREIADTFIGSGTLNLPAEMKGKYRPSVVAQAQSLAAKSLLDTGGLKAQVDAQREAGVKADYSKFANSKALINKAHQAGDKKSAGAIVEQLSEVLPMPFKYQYDEATDSFKEMYLHSGTGEWENRGVSLPYTEVIQKINTMQPKEFAAVEYAHKEAIRQWNELARLPSDMDGGKGQHLKKNGKEFYVFPQKPNDQTNRVAYIVMDKDNNEVEYPSIQALHNAGFRYEDLKREKAQADIEGVKARTDATRAEKGENTIKAQKAQIDFYNKQFNTSLAPFKEGSGGIGISRDANGQLKFEDGGAAFNKSQEFFHAHQGDWQSLSPKDQTKFHGAATADGLYKTMISIGRQQPQAMGGRQEPQEQPTAAEPYSGNQPPVEGARKAKDGKWYVQKNGKWEVVMDGGQSEKPANNNVAPPLRHGEPAGEEERVVTPGPEPQSQQIRAELPQDMNQWNFQIIPQNGQQVPVVITEQGPVPLTPEEVEMYRAFSAQQKRGALGSSIKSGTEWFKNNAMGTQQIPQ